MKLIYENFIYESRNIPTEDALKKKYFDLNDDSYFFSYRSINKIGVNPHSEWNTPNGVYSYNFVDMIGKTIPYTSESNSGYIYILKLKDNVKGIDSETYSFEDLNRDFDKLEEMYSDFYKPENLNTLSKPITHIWRATFNIKKSINDWSMIFLKLGYLYIRDRGTATIHHNEPTQTVFFSPKAYTVVEYGLYGGKIPLSSKIDANWLVSNYMDITEKEIKPIAKYLSSELLKEHYTIFAAIRKVKSEFVDKIYKEIINIVGIEKFVNDLIYTDFNSFINCSDEFYVNLINENKELFNNTTTLKWFNKIPEYKFMYFTEMFKDLIGKLITDNNFLLHIPSKYKFDILEMFKNEISESIMSNVNKVKDVIGILANRFDPNPNMEMFKILEDTYKKLTINGYTNWVNYQFKYENSYLDIANIALSDMKNEFNIAINNGSEFGDQFDWLEKICTSKENTALEVLIKIYNTFKNGFEKYFKDIKQSHTDPFWKNISITPKQKKFLESKMK